MKITIYVNRILAVGCTQDGQRKGIIYVLSDADFLKLYPYRHRRDDLIAWVVSMGELVEVHDMRVEMLDELIDFRLSGYDFFLEDVSVMEATIKNCPAPPSQVSAYFSKERDILHGVILPALQKELRNFLADNRQVIIQTLSTEYYDYGDGSQK